MDEERRRAEVARAEEARRILDSELWQDAWRMLEARSMRAWRDSAESDVKRRERVWLTLQIARRVRRHLEEAIATGRMASEQLESTRSADDGD